MIHRPIGSRSLKSDFPRASENPNLSTAAAQRPDCSIKVSLKQALRRQLDGSAGWSVAHAEHVDGQHVQLLETRLRSRGVSTQSSRLSTSSFRLTPFSSLPVVLVLHGVCTDSPDGVCWRPMDHVVAAFWRLTSPMTGMSREIEQAFEPGVRLDHTPSDAIRAF